MRLSHERRPKKWCNTDMKNAKIQKGCYEEGTSRVSRPWTYLEFPPEKEYTRHKCCRHPSSRIPPPVKKVLCILLLWRRTMHHSNQKGNHESIHAKFENNGNTRNRNFRWILFHFFPDTRIASREDRSGSTYFSVSQNTKAGNVRRLQKSFRAWEITSLFDQPNWSYFQVLGKRVSKYWKPLRICRYHGLMREFPRLRERLFWQPSVYSNPFDCCLKRMQTQTWSPIHYNYSWLILL